MYKKKNLHNYISILSNFINRRLCILYNYNFLIFKIEGLRYFHHTRALKPFFTESKNNLLSKKLNNFMGVKLMLK